MSESATPKLSPDARLAAAQMIEAKRDQLLTERERLATERQEILQRTRKNDRELADCRAAARLFELQIEFPADEREEMDRQMIMRRNEMEHDLMRRERERLTLLDATRRANIAPPAKMIDAKPRAAAPSAIVATPKKARPPLREVVLEQLRAAGSSGAKAAAIRDHIERTFGDVLHEKTVGMTLFRLAEKKLARREGHIWFSVPQSAETKNAGADTPALTKHLL